MEKPRAAQPRRWDLRESPADLAFKQRVRAFARDLRRVQKKAQQILAECRQLPSYQEADRMAEEGLPDPPTVGFNLSGSLETTIEALNERTERLEKAAAETVEDLLRDRHHGTADLGRFRR